MPGLSPPQLAPSKLVQFIKGRSSRLLQQEFPALRKRYWGQHLWARGYDTRLVRRPAVPVSQRLREISVPTLILSGARDHPQARANADEAEAAIPNATKMRLSGAAHLVNVDQPQRFNRAVLDFLSTTAGKRGEGNSR